MQKIWKRKKVERKMEIWVNGTHYTEKLGFINSIQAVTVGTILRATHSSIIKRTKIQKRISGTN